MLTMLKRMTVSAQNFQIFWCIVVAISVFVMHAQYFWMFVIPAMLAFQKHTASKHVFSYGSKRSFPNGFFCFINTGFRTIFSLVGRSVHKFFVAMQTSVFSFTFFTHCSVIANRTAIFSFVYSTRYVSKLRATFSAISYYFLPRRQTQAFTATKHCGIFTVFRNRKNGLAMFARYFIPNTGAFHATH